MESLAMPEKYAVRTLFITNYLSAAHDMAELRRNPTDTQALINAMKRVEIADRTLEAELNSIAEKGYRLQTALMHPQEDNVHDLLITAIFSRETENE
jgi:hypothetical protein